MEASTFFCLRQLLFVHQLSFLGFTACPALFGKVRLRTAQWALIVLEKLFPIVLLHRTALAGVAALLA